MWDTERWERRRGASSSSDSCAVACHSWGSHRHHGGRPHEARERGSEWAADACAPTPLLPPYQRRGASWGACTPPHGARETKASLTAKPQAKRPHSLAARAAAQSKKFLADNNRRVQQRSNATRSQHSDRFPRAGQALATQQQHSVRRTPAEGMGWCYDAAAAATWVVCVRAGARQTAPLLVGGVKQGDNASASKC